MVDIVGNETLASLWDKLARECGDKDFFIFQDREGNVATYSYRAFNELIDQTANMFLSQGVERGEHVAVQMHTCPEFLMCLFGLAKIGAVLVPMNEQYLQAECEYALDMCSTRRAVVEPCYVELYDAIHAGGRLDQGIIVARSESGKAGHGLPAVLRSLAAAEGTELEVPSDLSPDDPCEILFTERHHLQPQGRHLNPRQHGLLRLLR